MIGELVDKLLSPIRNVFSQLRGAANVPAKMKGDLARMKQIPGQLKNEAGMIADQGKALKADAAKLKAGAAKAKGAAQGAAAKAQGAVGQAQGAVGQAQGAAGQAQAAAGQAQAGQQKAKKKMGLFGKKNVCPNCGQPQEKSWDKCPFCINMASAMGAGGAPPGAPGPTGAFGGPAPGPPPGGAAQKTQMFQAGGMGGASMQLLGWLVPLKGQHKGELHTLKSQTVIGRDPTCDVVFNDTVMSSRHATIRGANGKFVLEDHSTNGTLVNDKRVTSHDLVDNDFIKFGNTLVKFKSLL